jgi:hypothetical protein
VVPRRGSGAQKLVKTVGRVVRMLVYREGQRTAKADCISTYAEPSGSNTACCTQHGRRGATAARWLALCHDSLPGWRSCANPTTLPGQLFYEYWADALLLQLQLHRSLLICREALGLGSAAGTTRKRNPCRCCSSNHLCVDLRLREKLNVQATHTEFSDCQRSRQNVPISFGC